MILTGNIYIKFILIEIQDKNVILFYGSQTGTAEDYASRLAKEGQQKFGLKTMTVDVEDCNMALLDKFPLDCVAFFLMATYGNTSNLLDFYTIYLSIKNH